VRNRGGRRSPHKEKKKGGKKADLKPITSDKIEKKVRSHQKGGGEGDQNRQPAPIGKKKKEKEHLCIQESM